MKTVCPKLCDECPFSKNSVPGWLSDYTPQILHNTIMSEVHFPCHKTHDKNLSFEEAENYPRCRGSLAYMRKNGKLPSDPAVLSLMKTIGQEELDQVMNVREFFKHHTA